MTKAERLKAAGFKKLAAELHADPCPSCSGVAHMWALGALKFWSCDEEECRFMSWPIYATPEQQAEIEDLASRRAPSDPPRTGAPWDKCKRCGRATDYKVSDQKTNRKTGKPMWFENWSCAEGCGYWWKIKGSDYKPEWKDGE